MAILHMAEIRKMKPNDLDKKLGDLKKELMRVRTQVSQGASPEKPGRVKEIRRTIAKILTFQHGRGVQK
ncbi:MAG TPA: 50S ribosomal protein L29 [Candidatus Woesearchaeota archaeon]|nr:50S ribosomal protein L29 [Candidatus Woesearchaeota archaeon]